MMKKSFFVGLLFVFTQILFAQGSYYDGINPGSSTFITDLHNLINPHTKISYDQYDETNIANFASRDTTNGQKVVTCVYSGENYVYTPPFTWVTFSREHTWCHSWMPTYPSTSGYEYSDQHHIFPTNQNKANGVRNNYPLGNVVTVTSQYLEGKFGKDANGNTVYEPRNSHKGDAARALFYMAVCYDGTGGRWFLPSFQDEETLKEWSEEDPPDDWEKSRNEYIYSIQKNRNPFVDHPEWVNSIEFYTLTLIGDSVVLSTEPSNYVTNFTVGTASSNSVTLSWTDALAGTQIPEGYFIVANSTNSFSVPSDGVELSDDTNLADGSAVVKISYSGQDSYTFSNLNSATTYYFKIYSYNGSGTSINYKTDGSIPSASATTSGDGNSTILLSQDWSNTNLITIDDDWSNVPNIVGYRGDNLTATTGTDPQTILADGTNTPVDVVANQTSPSTLTTGGVIEFEIANPVIALNGSGTADAPFILITVNTTGYSSVNVSYNVRDLDASTDNAIQQVALQYRIGTSGNFTNVPAAYIADATEANTDTMVTHINVDLPDEAGNQTILQIRIITTNAVGNDEAVGIDDILIKGLSSTEEVPEPTNYATSFSVISLSDNSVKLGWIDPVDGTQLPNGYLLVANNSNTFVNPSDDTFYNDDVDVSDGSAVINIPYLTDEYVFYELNQNTNYFFRLYSYTKTGNLINYKTDGDVPFASVTTSLPVELISFGAEACDGYIKLNWKTATETNNSGFSIERKMKTALNENQTNSNLEWKEIGFVKGAGSVSYSSSYSYVDETLPGYGMFDYRLKQIDYDGSVKYSDVVEIEYNYLRGFNLGQNFPNPFNPSTVISWSIPEDGKTTLKLYDVVGNEIAVILDEVTPAGKYSTPLTVANNLASGIYFYTLTSGKFSSTKKMILLR